MKMMTDMLLKQAGSFVSGMLGASLMIFLYHFYVEQKIATVNITRIISGFVQQESQQQIPPAQMKNDVRKFGRTLENQLRLYSVRHHLLLMPAEAIIAGSPDDTDQILSVMGGEKSR